MVAMTTKLVKDRDYRVEIWNDADEHYIRIEAFDIDGRHSLSFSRISGFSRFHLTCALLAQEGGMMKQSSG